MVLFRKYAITDLYAKICEICDISTGFPHWELVLDQNLTILAELKFLKREWYQLQHIQRWQEFLQWLAGIQKFNSRTRVVRLCSFELPPKAAWILVILRCCSRYNDLFKKIRLSWNGQVLAENEFSVWERTFDPFVGWVSLQSHILVTQWPNATIFFSKKPYDSYNW